MAYCRKLWNVLARDCFCVYVCVRDTRDATVFCKILDRSVRTARLGTALCTAVFGFALPFENATYCLQATVKPEALMGEIVSITLVAQSTRPLLHCCNWS